MRRDDVLGDKIVGWCHPFMYAGGVGGRSVTKCACRLCQRGLLREHVLQLVPDTTLCRCVRALYAVLLPCVLITHRAQSAVPPTLAKTTAGAAMCGACVVLAVASRFMCSLATGRVVACAHYMPPFLLATQRLPPRVHLRQVTLRARERPNQLVAKVACCYPRALLQGW